jgi:hypothetical protein
MKPNFDANKLKYPFSVVAKCRRCYKIFVLKILSPKLDWDEGKSKTSFKIETHVHRCTFIGIHLKERQFHEAYATQRPGSQQLSWKFS